jgi:hypothetical protein
MRQLNKDPKTRYPRDTLRGWVSKARAKGFLTEAPGRRAGGGPGPMLSDGPFDWKSIDDDQAREQLSLVLNKPVQPYEDGEDDVAPLVFEEES